MAKYEVTHACGHEETHQLYGKSAERDRKAAWLEARECLSCYLAKKEAARSASNRASAEANQARALPVLSGSEKQVAWAESIRAKAVAELDALPGEVRGLIADRMGVEDREALEEVEDALALLDSEIRTRVEARWWIDNREDRFDGRWALRQIRDRGLAPALSAAAEARKEGERAEQEERDARLAAAVSAFRPEAAVVELRESNGFIARDGAVAIKRVPSAYIVSDAAGEIGPVDRAGSGTLGDFGRFLPGFGSALQARVQEARVAAEADRRRARADSLAGVGVASASANRKREGNLTVSLADGRTLAGDYRVKTGCSIASLDGKPVDPDHPEVARIAAEAGKVVRRG